MHLVIPMSSLFIREINYQISGQWDLQCTGVYHLLMNASREIKCGCQHQHLEFLQDFPLPVDVSNLFSCRSLRLEYMMFLRFEQWVWLQDKLTIVNMELGYYIHLSQHLSGQLFKVHSTIILQTQRCRHWNKSQVNLTLL